MFYICKCFYYLSETCEEKKCEFYAVCEMDSNAKTKCVCPGNCSGADNVSRKKSLFLFPLCHTLNIIFEIYEYIKIKISGIFNFVFNVSLFDR